MRKNMKRRLTHPQICCQEFVKYTCRTQKTFGLICFPRICFPGLIYCDQEPLWLLNVIEDDCYFLGVHIRLSTRCKMFHSKIT